MSGLSINNSIPVGQDVASAADSKRCDKPLLDKPTGDQKRVEWSSQTFKIGSAIAAAVSSGAVQVQNKADFLGREIEKAFSSLASHVGWDALNTALNKSLDGDWKAQLAKSLMYVPARSVVKILKLIYSYIQAVLVGIVHPKDSFKKLVAQLKAVGSQLTQPETWTTLGVGMIGSGLGSAAVGNPLSTIGLIIGTASLVGGLSAGAIKEALNAKAGSGRSTAALENFKCQLRNIPQALSDGFFMGLFIGGIQRALKKPPVVHDKWSSVKKYADDYVKAKNLPQNYSDAVASNNSPGNIHIRYLNGEALESAKAHPIFAEEIRKIAANPQHAGFNASTTTQIEVVLGPNARVAIHGTNTVYGTVRYDVVGINPEKLFGPYRLPTPVDYRPVPVPPVTATKPVSIATVAYPVIFATSVNQPAAEAVAVV